MTAGETHRAIEAVFRQEQARLIAGLARLVRHLDRAEELAQDALVTALSVWTKTGVPDNPGAWLMTAARRRAIDLIRHDKMRLRKQSELGQALGQNLLPLDDDAGMPFAKAYGDELLGLIFTACHPILSPDARAALTLRIIGGLTVEQIARAFLSNETAIAQRLVRAKKTIAKANLGFHVPAGEERAARLPSVLEVIYLIFNEGYAATSGDDLVNPALCQEGQRLGRLLAGLMPDEAEVFGLLALMDIQASRLSARIDLGGNFVPLNQQNRAHWDQRLIRRGFEALAMAETLGGSGPYILQAKLAACHACAQHAKDTDWHRIAELYDQLRLIMPSAVVDLNRAIAHSMAYGPEQGLDLLDQISDQPALQHYAPLPAARGDFLYRLGRLSEARAEFVMASKLTRNKREADFLRGRAKACG